MRPRIDAEVLLTDLRRVAGEYGEFTYEAYRFYGLHAADTLLKRFGTWNAAVKAAGLTCNQAGRKRMVRR